ncbi:hypothetical protein M8C21_014836, partial [Ambrosia artemisiifolia]
REIEERRRRNSISDATSDSSDSHASRDDARKIGKEVIKNNGWWTVTTKCHVWEHRWREGSEDITDIDAVYYQITKSDITTAYEKRKSRVDSRRSNLRRHLPSGARLYLPSYQPTSFLSYNITAQPYSPPNPDRRHPKGLRFRCFRHRRQRCSSFVCRFLGSLSRFYKFNSWLIVALLLMIWEVFGRRDFGFVPMARKFSSLVLLPFNSKKPRDKKLDGGKMSRTWIMYNKPEEPNITHAGLLLALGLHGHLDVLTITNIYQYYAQCPFVLYRKMDAQNKAVISLVPIQTK